MDNTITLPILGTIPIWLALLGIAAIILIIRFVAKLVTRLASSAVIFALYLWLGHGGFFPPH